MGEEAVTSREVWMRMIGSLKTHNRTLMEASRAQEKRMDKLMSLYDSNENLSEEVKRLRVKLEERDQSMKSKEELIKCTLDMQKKLELELEQRKLEIESLEKKLQSSYEANNKLIQRVGIAGDFKVEKIEKLERDETGSDVDVEVHGDEEGDANNETGHPDGNETNDGVNHTEFGATTEDVDVEEEKEGDESNEEGRLMSNQTVEETGDGSIEEEHSSIDICPTAIDDEEATTSSRASANVVIEEDLPPILEEQATNQAWDEEVADDEMTLERASSSPPILQNMKRAALIQLGSEKKKKRRNSLNSTSSSDSEYSDSEPNRDVSICEDASIPILDFYGSSIIDMNLALTVSKQYIPNDVLQKIAYEDINLESIKKTQHKKSNKGNLGKAKIKAVKLERRGRPLGSRNKSKKWPCWTCKKFFARNGKELQAHVKQVHYDTGYKYSSEPKYGWCCTCLTPFSLLKEVKNHPKH